MKTRAKRVLSVASRLKMSESMKRAWQTSPKLAAMRVEDPEHAIWRTSKLRGVKQSREHVEKRAARLRGTRWTAERRERAKGRKLSPAHYAKASKYFLRGFSSLSPEAQAKARASISKSRRGTHGYGRSARDNPEHARARHWVIRDPRGVTYEFNNLQAWCRANEFRFNDSHPDSILPLWRRAVLGFNNMQRKDAKATHGWCGWTLVGNFELTDDHTAPDPLDRVPLVLSR